METPSLIAVCAIAFAVVFSVLGALAAAIGLMTALFPVRAPRIDGATVAAIASVVSSLVPGARVTRIEEES